MVAQALNNVQPGTPDRMAFYYTKTASYDTRLAFPMEKYNNYSREEGLQAIPESKSQSKE